MAISAARSATGPSSTYKRIYREVKRIPHGRVATYGQIAQIAGLPGHARQVGYALNALPADSGVPWHRVINASGQVSARSDPDDEEIQRRLLEQEGVELGLHQRVCLARYRWRPRSRRWS